MIRMFLVSVMSTACFVGACAEKQEAQPSAEAAEAAEKSAGGETRVIHHNREIDPDWDSAEEADEQLEGD